MGLVTRRRFVYVDRIGFFTDLLVTEGKRPANPIFKLVRVARRIPRSRRRRAWPAESVGIRRRSRFGGAVRQRDVGAALVSAARAHRAGDWWRRRLAGRSSENSATAFVPVHVTDDGVAAGGGIEIVLAGERRVHLIGPVDRQALADVLAVLTTEVCDGDARPWAGEARPC